MSFPDIPDFEEIVAVRLNASGTSTSCAIVIVTYNSSAHIRACLNALCGFDILVVDNASDDDTCCIVEHEYPEVSLIRLGKNVGLSRAFNIGWRGVSAEYVLFINPDVIIEPCGVDELIAVAKHTSAAVVAPRLVYLDGSTQVSARSFPTLASMLASRTMFGATRLGRSVLGAHLSHTRSDETYQYADWVLGAAMLLNRLTLERLAGFDRKYFLYCEDVDYCARAWKTGSTIVYVPTVTFRHAYQRQSQKTWNVRSRATRAHFASALRLACKFPLNFLGSPLRRASDAPVPSRIS